MATFFSDNFIAELKTGGVTSMTAVNVRMYVFPNAPAFVENDPRYVTKTTLSELESTLGWGPAISPTSPDLLTAVNTVTATATNFLTVSSEFNLPTTFPATRASALAFVYQSGTPGDPEMAGRLIFVTNTIFSDDQIILYNQDGIIPAPDPQNIPSGPSNRWLMSWTAPAAGQVSVGVGELTVMRGTIPFEPARTQHVWMYPQRVNMIANPSFEAGVTHWKSTATKTNPTPGIDSAHYGHFTGGASPLVVESNTFPTRIRKSLGDGWTVLLTARGDGPLKIATVSWPAAFDQTVVDWGPVKENTWTLNGTTWTTIRTLRRIYEMSWSCLRLETTGTFLDIDRICVEPGWMPANGDDWPYFDGDSTYGMLDDYSWYGEDDRPVGTPTRQHKTYSCWYNHRRVVTGRLFQWIAPDDTGPSAVFTDEEVASQGMVYNWVPAGTPVQQHLDVLYQGDPRSAVPDVTGGVTPRPSGGTDMMGVPTPW